MLSSTICCTRAAGAARGAVAAAAELLLLLLLLLLLPEPALAATSGDPVTCQPYGSFLDLPTFHIIGHVSRSL